MKAITLPAVLFALSLVGADASAQRLPPVYRDQHRHDHDHSRPASPMNHTVVRQRADALANELDEVLEHLDEDLAEGHGGRDTERLFEQAEGVLQEAVHFRRSVRNETPPRQVYEHFGVLDRQVHDLMRAIQGSKDAALRRSLFRLAYADELLHAAVTPGGGPPTAEFVARQAHVLADEAQRLEQAVRSVIARQDRHEGGDHHGDPQLIEAVHDFVDKVEHFHETAEHDHDFGHLRTDFALVDRSWQRVVELMSRNPHGAYLYRRAERVGAMHDDLTRLIGVRAERRPIRFNLGGIGVQIGR